jgi:hypothetical protein
LNSIPDVKEDGHDDHDDKHDDDDDKRERKTAGAVLDFTGRGGG